MRTADAFRSIVRKEGLRGFYKGMVPNLMRTMPQSAVTFVVYEGILGALKHLGGGNDEPSAPPA